MVSDPSGRESLEASGVLHRTRESGLSFPIAGALTRLNVDAGDTIRPGQVLALLDDTPFRARLAQAAADLDRARRDVDRYQALATKGFVAGKFMDDQRTVLIQAQGAYDTAAFDKRWTRLIAPAGGVVLARSAQAGEVVQPGQVIFTTADETSGLVLRVPIADRDLPKVRVGAGAEVRLASLPSQVLRGAVERIGQQVDPSSATVQVDVTVPAAPGLRSGMVGQARIDGVRPLGARAATSRVPAEAILEAQGPRAVVYRLDPPGVARRTAVTLQGFDGDDALVTGLPPGTRLITAGAGFVSDGERVTAIARAPAAPRPEPAL